MLYVFSIVDEVLLNSCVIPLLNGPIFVSFFHLVTCFGLATFAFSSVPVIQFMRIRFGHSRPLSHLLITRTTFNQPTREWMVTAPYTFTDTVRVESQRDPSKYRKFSGCGKCCCCWWWSWWWCSRCRHRQWYKVWNSFHQITWFKKFLAHFLYIWRKSQNKSRLSRPFLLFLENYHRFRTLNGRLSQQ